MAEKEVAVIGASGRFGSKLHERLAERYKVHTYHNPYHTKKLAYYPVNAIFVAVRPEQIVSVVSEIKAVPDKWGWQKTPVISCAAHVQVQTMEYHMNSGRLH